MLSLTGFVATILLLVTQVMAGGFAYTCDLPFELNGSRIYGSCLMEDGQWETHNGFDLNNCVTNSFGTLYGQPNGNYASSCTDCGLNGSILYCQCGDGQGGHSYSQIDLNIYIGNNNGWLECWGIA